MIKFKQLRMQNFFSVGDSPITIQLDKNPATLVSGFNGCGKSGCLLDSLSYVLFGKPYRNIPKPLVINSVNKKNCLVEIDFEIGTHLFTIKRGMRPAIFEIWQNGDLLNQTATSRDYQKHLEQNILKLNYKSFNQIVVLGASSFTPFMELPTGSRREVIEDLLDIQIFSKMNLLLKEQILKIKDQARDINHEIDILKEKIILQKKYIYDISQLNEKQIDDKKKEIADIEFEKEKLEEESRNLQKQIKELTPDTTELEKKREEIFDYSSTFRQKIKALVKDIRFYEINDVCPTCTQTIQPDFKEQKINQAKNDAKTLDTALNDVNIQIEKINTEWNNAQAAISENKVISQSIDNNIQAKEKLNTQIQKIKADIDSLTHENSDVAKAKDELSTFESNQSDLVDKKFTLNQDLSYADAAAELLKDNGIKTKVIKEYLPIINSLVNKFLHSFDFFVSFNLNENFEESMKSRHRDEFKYASFSEGEKMRIDLSLLFTWRAVARMKNSVSTNLLILDEIFDSSADQAAVDAMIKIINKMTNSNIFIISHKIDAIEDKFSFKMNFLKEGNFTRIEIND